VLGTVKDTPRLPLPGVAGVTEKAESKKDATSQSQTIQTIRTSETNEPDEILAERSSPAQPSRHAVPTTSGTSVIDRKEIA
jgi:hypothetical protein